MRKRLQEPQKWSDMEVMKPTWPLKPGTLNVCREKQLNVKQLSLWNMTLKWFQAFKLMPMYLILQTNFLGKYRCETNHLCQWLTFWEAEMNTCECRIFGDTDLGSFCVSSLKLFQVRPLLPDAVQHLLVTHHFLKIPLVACREEKGQGTMWPILSNRICLLTDNSTTTICLMSKISNFSTYKL